MTTNKNLYNLGLFSFHGGKNMKYKIGALVVTNLLLLACSSGQIPSEKAQAPQSMPLVQRNFVVRDRSHSEPPLWSYDFMSYSGQVKGDDRFFVGDSGDVNERIAGCDIAKGRARQEIAQEMATFITSKMNESAEGQAVINKMESNSGGIDRKFSSSLSQEAVALLAGVEVVSTSWEERDYTQAGGAKQVFNCKALVKISKRTLEDVVKKTAKKAVDQAPVADRASLAKTLAEAPKQFANQTTPTNL